MTVKPTGSLLLTLLLAASGTAQLQTNGYLKGLAYVNPHSGSYERLGTRLQTRFTADWQDRMGLFAGINYEIDLAGSPSDTTEQSPSDRIEIKGDYLLIYPVEFYLDLHTLFMDLRFGQQYIFWGSTDWINPTDVINLWDYENLSSEIEDYRLSVLALRSDMYVGDLAIQAVLVPRFTPAAIPLPPGTIKHDRLLKVDQAQYGLRLTSYLGATDVSLSYFKGYDPNPTITAGYDPSAMSPMSMEATYEPYTMAGWDFVRSINAFAIKGEGAWYGRTDSGGDDPFIRNSSIKTVLGLDYIPSDRLSFNLQVVHEGLLNYDEDEEQARLVDLELDRMMTAPNRATYSLSGLVSWLPAKYVTGQVVAVYNIKDGDALAMGFLLWEMADALNLTLGGVFFQGSDGSPFGRLDEEDKLFIELKAAF